MATGKEKVEGTTVQSLAITVVEAIADTEGVEPTELDFTLYDYIDTEILRRLGEQGATDWHFQFTVADHTVIVDSDDTITVDGQLY